MSRRVVLLGALCLLLVGLWVSIMLVPKGQGYRPIFLANAALAPVQESRLRNAPFVKKIGPNSNQSLGTSGVSCNDYLVAGSFDDIQKQAKAELTHSDGWEAFFSAPENPPIGKFIPVAKMDALYTRGNEAVTIYRESVEGQVRVRVWHRSSSPLAHLF